MVMLKKSADLVLQGGVTSALVYIGLIRRLSRTYRFKRLGGASSGAVAAAAAAIAEHSRQHPKTGSHLDPFRRLGQFAVELAQTDRHGDTQLFKLFQPQAPTQRGWAIVSAGLRHWPLHKCAAVRSAFRAALWQYPLIALLALLVCVAPPVYVWTHDLHAWTLPFVSSLVAALVGGALLAVLAVLVWTGWATWVALRTNHFGFCTGMDAEVSAAPADLAKLPLSLALHGLFNSLADLPVKGRPVLFADLWGEGADEAQGADGKVKEREIDLQVITTCLSLERPYRLPGDPGLNPLQGFFYDPAEWAEFFPLPVMAMLKDAQVPYGGPPVTNAAGVELRTLPMPRHWPVLMAVRLSLSFPVLLAAVPMYTLDGARDRRMGAGETRFVARKVYFSDGGITNNCPVQLFDAPLPRRPTFVVRLDDLPDEHPKRYRVWLDGDPGDPPPRVRPVAGILDFVGALVGTMMHWRDSVQMGLPGYRERVARVGLRPDEGGLNLAMPPPTIRSLVALGAMAASKLDRAFNAPRTAGRFNRWDQHRWVRLCSTLSATQRQLREIANSRSEVEGDPSNAALLAQRPALLPALGDAALVAEAQALLTACTALGRDAAAPALDLNAAEPAPRLRMSSPW